MAGSFNQLIQIFLLNSMKTKLINNYPKVFLFWIMLLLTFINSSCIEIYENDPTLTAKVLMVEGFTTNLLEADTIEVNFSNGRGVNIEITPVKNCKLSIISDDGKSYNLQEDSEGKYYTPSNMLRQVGRSYKLKISIPNGDNYESNFEKMNEVPTAKAYDVFDEKAIITSNGNNFRKGNKVYVDFQDAPDETNQYLFRYKYYEQIAICKTCFNGKYLGGDGLTCIPLIPYKFTPGFDYKCNGDCWDIYYNNSVNIFSDIYTNGKLIKGVFIGAIPYVNYSGALMEIKQYSLSSEVYRFYNLLYLQGQKTGSLTDTPPSPLVGNIRNIDNPEKTVTGFFGASEVKYIRYTVDRQKNIGIPEEYLGYVPTPENLPELKRVPPEALCIESKTRTKIKPMGWTK
jgi:hypothetical protein